MSPFHVLIVEDNETVREFLSARVSEHPHLRLSAAVGTRQLALEWLQTHMSQVDALLCDLGLPDGSGLDVIRYAVTHNPNCEALVISMFGDQATVLASIEAGAVGYIHKDAEWRDVAQTILDMKAGASPMSPMIARGVLSRFKQLSGNRPTAPPPSTADRAPDSDSVNDLSPRERTVLDLIARGFSYAEIARLQSMSVNTVQTHIKNLYRKLAVHSKNEAVFEGTRRGLIRVHQ